MKTTFLFLCVILAACFTGFASDVYAPSLPSIAEYFSVSVDRIQWSMAIYMLAVALSQLVYGPLSEGFGRKGPLMTGLVVMFLGSGICLFAQSPEALIWGRFVQGCGAGACAGLWRPIFRDVFSGDDLAKYGSYLTLVLMLIVPAAPALGGYLQQVHGWRASFVFMAIFAFIALVFNLFFLVETNGYHHKDRLKLSFIKASYGLLLSDSVFMRITCCTMLCYGAFFSWFVVGPVLLIKEMGVSPLTFGWIAFLGAVGTYGPAAWINGKVVKRFGSENMLRFGWGVMFIAALWLLLGYFIFGTTILCVILPVFLFFFGSTFIWPNAFSLAFRPHGSIAGYAGALYGFMQIVGGAIFGALVSYLPDVNQVPLSLIMMLAPLLSWMIYDGVRCRLKR